MPLDAWLIREFALYSTLWQSQAELEQTARDIIASVERNNAEKISLHEHLDKGKSRESWLAKRIEQGATAEGVTNVGAYAAEIDQAMGQANQDMHDTIMTQSGNVNRCLNLDGFIAEQHHVDTFNLEAAAQGSGYRARVLTPDGTTYSKNSMDIGIYDANGKLVKRYQAKYGQDADSTEALFDKGNYRGQRKLVPADQVDQVDNATDVIEVDGIKSKPLTKAEAKDLQAKAQLEAEAKQYDWNDANRITIAQNIGKQALIGAALTTSMQGTRILGRRTWNWITSKKNPPASEDMREFFESSLKSASNVGAQVAVSGALVVAVKNGWISGLLKNTPAGKIVNIAYVGMENAKIIYKYAKGEVSGKEALDSMGGTTVSVIGSLAGATKGSVLGGTIGTVFGPVGTVVGGLVGGVVGGIAGSKIGQSAYQAGKIIVKTAVSETKRISNPTLSSSYDQRLSRSRNKCRIGGKQQKIAQRSTQLANR
ncbi:MAG: hypothetical protein QJT81_21605 [Candidatus Thiothrix putei]|uniref:Glycine zipper domain-containing protein n=1 Tax=Candidatus Thiothrix putei TaxID=3080811 RepID=A0AA95HCE3_9GAMM|nr:MAG: hypothetical protein QJT81_21605 [Candidatus Thiothrix putei]